MQCLSNALSYFLKGQRVSSSSEIRTEVEGGFCLWMNWESSNILKCFTVFEGT